jgi:UDP-N-acetyl-D-mannosaminuronate dehydrogenase
LRDADAVVIVADHSHVDYDRLAREARLIVDTRGIMRRHAGQARVVGLSAGAEDRTLAGPVATSG